MQADRYRQILESLGDAVYVVDRNRLITYWNAAAVRITGYGPEEVVGKFCFDNLLDHVDCRGKNMCRAGCPLAGTIDDAQPREIEAYLRHKDGQRVPVLIRAMPLRDSAGRVTGAVEVFAENRETLAAREERAELERAALIDPLTLIGNRRLADVSVASHLAEMRRLGWPFGVLLADVDGFKQVNDRHGHQAGDAALRVVAATLAGAIRVYDQVARWGGEEFLVLCPGLDSAGLVGLADRLRVLVERSDVPLASGERLGLTISLGVAEAVPGDTTDTLLARVDAALYRAKGQGKNRVAAAN
ncbi:MAG: diguanylate cyclase [Acidobacteria bacterium]|nr:MAG: diguanylate cyclase [Acidobacteriota bacterium]RPJ76988.1 MAG: diguanylate cyclase [Acidobacteriota bacterium]